MRGGLLPADVIRVAASGLRARRVRTLLSALGIAIGIASLVSVLGLSASSREGLVRQLDALGTDLLTAGPGQTLAGDAATLPLTTGAAVRRIAGVDRVSTVRPLGDASVRRSDRIDREETGGLSVQATDLSLLATMRGEMLRGRFLNAATARGPAVVLGIVAAERLGIDRPGRRVYIAGRWFTVVGIMAALPLAPDLDRSALVGYDAAVDLLGSEREPGRVYARAAPDAVERVSGLLAATVNPAHPEEVEVTRPSDALAARAAAEDAFTGLFLGLGAVALLVGGIGIANTMVISVLERRSEIGLRRALGATRGHVRVQFLGESLLLSGLGGLAGVVLGAVATVVYAEQRGWATVVPPEALGGGLAAALLIGALAGLYPAARAARLSPVDALRST